MRCLRDVFGIVVQLLFFRAPCAATGMPGIPGARNQSLRHQPCFARSAFAAASRRVERSGHLLPGNSPNGLSRTEQFASIGRLQSDPVSKRCSRSRWTSAFLHWNPSLSFSFRAPAGEAYLSEPNVGEILVQEMAAADLPALHVGPHRQNSIPPCDRQLMCAHLQHLAFILPHQHPRLDRINFAQHAIIDFHLHRIIVIGEVLRIEFMRPDSARYRRLGSRCSGNSPAEPRRSHPPVPLPATARSARSSVSPLRPILRNSSTSQCRR